MAKNRNKAVPAVYLILRKGTDVLMMRRAKASYEGGKYMPPAGHVEAGELPQDAAVRETREETGVTVRAEDVRFAHAMYRKAVDETGDRLDIFFETSIWSGSPGIMEPDKCEDMRWFDEAELPENTIAYVKTAFELAEKGIRYSER